MAMPVLLQAMLVEAQSDVIDLETEQEKCWNLMTGGTLVLSKELMAHGMFWQHEKEIQEIELEIASALNGYAHSCRAKGAEPDLDFDDDIPF